MQHFSRLLRGWFKTDVIQRGYLSLRTYNRDNGYTDIFSHLLKQRIICLMTTIDENVAGSVIAQLLLLQSDDSHRPIQLYINSPGGQVPAGLAIYDTMQHISAPVVTWCVGQACSMASLLLSAGSPGQRFSLPNSRIMIHQPSAANISGTATDIIIQSDEIKRIKEKVIELYAKHSKRTWDEVTLIMERDKYMSPDEAAHFGLIDKVRISPPKKSEIDGVSGTK
ncbi:hypothetical protein ACOME3_003293 [Neoechinorhynchus agilis]